MKLKLYNDFRKGFNDTVAPSLLDAAEMQEAENVDLSERGGFTTRKGCDKMNTTAIAGNVVFGFEWLVGSEERTLIIENNAGTRRMGKLNAGGTIDWLTWPTLAADEIGFVVVSNVLYFGDGTKIYSWGAYDWHSTQGSQTIAQYDVVKRSTDKRFYRFKLTGATVNLSTEDYTNVTRWEDVTGIVDIVSNVVREAKANTAADNHFSTTISKCTIFKLHTSSMRVFASGNPEDPTSVYFSEYGDFRYFKETNKLYPMQNGGPVTALVALSDALMVSYANGWYYWRGIDPTTDAVWKPMAIPYGAVSHHAVAMTPFSFMFLGRNNIHKVSASILSQELAMIQPNSILTSVSEGKVENLIKTFKMPSKAKAVFKNDKYMLAFRDEDGLAYNNKVLIYDFNSGGFSVWTGWKHYCWIEKTNGDLYFTSNKSVLKAETGYKDYDPDTATYVPIHLKVLTRYFDLDQVLNPKEVRQAFFIYRQHDSQDPSTMNITVYGDYAEYREEYTAEPVNLDDSLIWGRGWGKVWGYSDMTQKAMELHMIANTFQIKIENNTIDDVITVYGIGFSYDVLEPNTYITIGREEGLLV